MMSSFVTYGYEREFTLLVVFLFAVVFNVVYHRSSGLFLFCAALVVVVYYYNSKVTNIKESMITNQKMKKTLKGIVESFEPTNFVSSSYDVFEIPRRFRYMFLKADLWKALYDIRFVHKFNDGSFVKLFTLLENFMKLFYETIKRRVNMKNAVETLKQMHELVKEIREDFVMNLPSSAKRAHRVLNTSFVAIEDVMISKIRMLQALVDGKIK